jgi:toxin CcdB
MQHDVFANPAPRTRRAFPFLAVLQADLAGESRGRIVAPLAPRAAMPGAVGRLLPVVRHEGREFLLALELMTSVPLTELRHPVGSIAAHRDDITRALDWLFTGI